MYKYLKSEFLKVSTVLTLALGLIIGIFNINSLENLVAFFLGNIVGMIKLSGTIYLVKNAIGSADIVKRMFSLVFYIFTWFILIVFTYFVAKLQFIIFVYSVLGITSATISVVVFNFKKYFYEG